MENKKLLLSIIMLFAGTSTMNNVQAIEIKITIPDNDAKIETNKTTPQQTAKAQLNSQSIDTKAVNWLHGDK